MAKMKKTTDLVEDNHYASSVDKMVGNADVYDGRVNAMPKENNPVMGADSTLNVTKVNKVRKVSK